MKIIYQFCLFLYGLMLLTSCSSIKNVKYFNDISDSVKLTNFPPVNYVEPVIKTNDIIAVNIQTVDPSATQVLQTGNLQNSAVGATSTGSTGNQTISGYQVDKEGSIELPVLGKIMVSGFTIEQAREMIRSRAAELYRNPSVNVRFSNFKITILGEVSKPGTYVVSGQNINVLDALGLAGDLTIYGKRENVVLIRQNDDGSRQLVKLDLTRSSVLNSPFYYLRQNDYLYIEPSKSKVASSDAIQNRNISIITAIGASLISVIAILLSTR